MRTQSRQGWRRCRRVGLLGVLNAAHGRGSNTQGLFYTQVAHLTFHPHWHTISTGYFTALPVSS